MLDQVVTTAAPPNASLDEILAMLEEAKAAGLVDPARAGHLTARVAIGHIDTADVLRLELNCLLAEGSAAEQALAAIAPLFRPGETTELRALMPGGGAFSRCGRLDVPAERQELIDSSGRPMAWLTSTSVQTRGAPNWPGLRSVAGPRTSSGATRCSWTSTSKTHRPTIRSGHRRSRPCATLGRRSSSPPATVWALALDGNSRRLTLLEAIAQGVANLRKNHPVWMK
jgi:hypothetical protein